MNKRQRLEMAFDYADEYVLTHTKCPSIADISKGFCDVWAKAVWRKAKFVKICEGLGHYFIIHDGVAYDSDYGICNGFEPEYSQAAQHYNICPRRRA